MKVQYVLRLLISAEDLMIDKHHQEFFKNVASQALLHCFLLSTIDICVPWLKVKISLPCQLFEEVYHFCEISFC